MEGYVIKINGKYLKNCRSENGGPCTIELTDDLQSFDVEDLEKTESDAKFTLNWMSKRGIENIKVVDSQIIKVKVVLVEEE